MGFSSVKSYVDAMENGQTQITNFRKTLTYAGAATVWTDLSMSGGNPRPNFYAATPLESATLNGNYGLYHGANVSPSTKHLSRITTSNAIASAGGFLFNFKLLDYLMYYPFIDGDSTDEQILTTTTTLPRYTSGVGVMAMLIAQGGYTGGQNVVINYTNSDGVANRITTPMLTNTVGITASSLSTVPLGTQVTASRTYGWPFIPLVGNDKGIRSVQSITFEAPIGGVHALVLVKPIADYQHVTQLTPSEKSYFTDLAAAPRIYDGAYLNFIMQSSAAGSAGNTFNGTIETVWGND